MSCRVWGQLRYSPAHRSTNKTKPFFYSSRSYFLSPPLFRRRRRTRPLSSMAMMQQAGMGLTKIIILAGAGLTGSVVLRNGRLSEILAELQAMLKDKSGEQSGADSDHAEVLAAQVRRLALEVQRLASGRSITVLNGNSTGNATSLLVPAATLGAVGYGYMWWKGLSFSDLMYVTKQNMSSAVSKMTEHLEKVSASLAATKRHLTQRIENLDGKMDEQKELSTEIRNGIIDARVDVTNIGYDVNSLKQLLCSLDGKADAIELKQNFTCAGVMYLCEAVGGKDRKFAELVQEGQKITGRRYLGPTGTRSIKGLLDITTEAMESGIYDQSKVDAILQN